LQTVKLSEPIDNSLGLNLIASIFYTTFFDDLGGPLVIFIGGKIVVFFTYKTSLV
jgi:hypothetical protein